VDHHEQKVSHLLYVSNNLSDLGINNFLKDYSQSKLSNFGLRGKAFVIASFLLDAVQIRDLIYFCLLFDFSNYS
jgi:hypothetical protein